MIRAMWYYWQTTPADMAHSNIDARSFAFGEHMVGRLRKNPELLEVARGQLERWRKQCAPNVQATLAEWQLILDAGLGAVAAVLCGEDERSVRLRQSAPFAGEKFISREERNAILRRFAA